MAKAAIKAPEQLSMFDINGPDKLTSESVEERLSIIKHYCETGEALAFFGHSGGKDSMAAYEIVKNIIPADKLIVVHATLGKYEHKGVIEHIQKNIEQELVVVQNEHRSLIDQVLLRKMWFSPKYRTCTSDFKTNPIDAYIKKNMREQGVTIGFNITGIRAEESRMRAKKSPLILNKRLTTTGKRVQRTVFDWLPIFHFDTDMVWETVKNAGKSLHSVYGAFQGDGNDRLSCVLCCMANLNDLKNGALNYPDIYAEYIAVERVINHTLFVRSKQRTIKEEKVDLITGKVMVTKRVERTVIPVPLEEKIGLPLDEIAVARKMRELKIRMAELEQIKADSEAMKQTKRAQKSTELNVDKHELREEQLGFF